MKATIPDLALFQPCIGEVGPVERIEEDIAAAQALEARGTPKVVVNGVLYYPPPDSIDLETMLKDVSTERKK